MVKDKLIRILQIIVPMPIRNAIWKCIFFFKYALGYWKQKKLSFNVLLAEHCNLNCKGCHSFCPVAEEVFLDVETFTRDCAQMALIAQKHISSIGLQGGEPLLNRNITEIIYITRKHFPSADISIVTNGILLPNMPEDFWVACKENKVLIRISFYPIQMDTKKIIEMAFKHKVGIVAAAKFKADFKCFKYDIYGQQDCYISYSACTQKRCYILSKGRFHTCQAVPLIPNLNKYYGTSFSVSPEDSIDIYKIKNAKPLLKYIKKPIPFCRYCNTKELRRGEWDISKKARSEWL